MNLTAEQLLTAAPRANTGIVASIVAAWPDISAKYGLTNRNRALGFLSTACEESGGFIALSENLNYSAERAFQVFGGIFPTVESARPYAFQPEKFANKVYGGRMGNAGPDDGWRYRGQGLIQITGRNNFAYLEKLTGLPLLDNPAMATSQEHMLECAVALFAAYPRIMTWCDDANWRAVWALVGSGRATGPVINFAAHEAALEAMGRALPEEEASPVPAATGSIRWTQEALNRAGASPLLIEDGVYGEATRAAMIAFQTAHPPLAPDGVVGPETIAALSA